MMKKLITLFLGLTLFSCNDGDFDIPAFEFTETMNSCGEYILYKTSQDKTEVLVLSLSNVHINSTLGEVTYPVSSTLKVTYRIFETGISANYFCQSIPPATPKVIKELLADSGNLNITTSEILVNGVQTGYTYKISISNLLFLDTKDRIFFENYNFGTFTKNN